LKGSYTVKSDAEGTLRLVVSAVPTFDVVATS
jgi:hypothetical protein